MTLVCENCGFVNKPGSKQCEMCGHGLMIPETYGIKSEPSKRKPGLYGYTGTLKYSDRGVNRTELGLLLFAIGLFIGWIPYINYLGAFLVFLGAIFILIGRSAFSAQHDLYALLAFILVILSFIIYFVMDLNLGASIVSIVVSSTPLSQEVTRLDIAFNAYLLFFIVFSFLSGLSYILFTYGLQDKVGKMMLFTAYGLTIVISVIMYIAIVPIVHNAFLQIIAHPGSASAVGASMQGKITLYGLLGVIPDFILGVAYLHARSLIPGMRHKHLQS